MTARDDPIGEHHAPSRASESGVAPRIWADLKVPPDTPSCVLIGSEVLLIQCGEMLLRRGWRITAIVSRAPVIGRWAKDNDLALFGSAEALCEEPAIGAIDYLFSVTNLSILSRRVLALARKAAINFHDGPLPGYAGLNTPVWAMLNGETAHGVTWHLMTGGIDRGHILEERAIAIDPADTALTLNAKCFAAGIESFDELLEALAEGRMRPTVQPIGKRRYYGRAARPPAAGLIDWSQPAHVIDRQVRALQFGQHFNPIGTAKTAIGGRLMIVQATTSTAIDSIAAAGTIMRIDTERFVVATATTDLAILGVATLDGATLTIAEAALRFDLASGVRFDPLDAKMAAWIGTTDATVALHEADWRKRLADAVPVDLPQVDRMIPVAADHGHCDALLPAAARGVCAHHLAAAAFTYFARLTDRDDIAIGYANPIMVAQSHDGAGCFAAQVPLSLPFRFDMAFDTLCSVFAAEVRALHRLVGFCTDLPARAPELRGTSWAMPVAVVVVDDLVDVRPLPGADVTLAIRADGGACRWCHAPERIAAEAVMAMHHQFTLLLEAALADPTLSIATLPMLDAIERTRILHDWNATEAPWRDDACIHDLIAEQVARTPEAVAIVCRGLTLTYRELDARANQLARRLITCGVGPDVLVGLFADRSIELPVAMLAIHKAGGAYVPLDPEYPADRITHMIADAHMPVLLITGHMRDRLPPTDAMIIALDEEWPAIARESAAPIARTANPAHLAYVIYTSGSTGKPKGVMVEHRNVVNFFAGMDARIAAPGTWLAVTSLSFDISVLELSWTLTRGFTVVIQPGDIAAALAPSAARPPLDFSLFYFASDAGEDGAAKYRLLLEGAKFADGHGFAAVWTPERHFHAFGGLYPNPSVTSAAIAAVTERVQIRAGSVVLPLHHPARVAEEWSVVDNLSNGRVGISFAAGWQPDDFVLRPENFADAKQVMLRDIDTVRRLWRGEAVEMPGALGKPVAVRTLPRPVQRELPFWLTAAGNIETFEAAGRLGALLLTHLLGQTVDELGEKLAAYRRAWHEAGHPGEPRATLMLHSFVGMDQESVRAVVRGPLIEYLRSSASLIKQYAWSFPAFKRRPGMEQAGDVDLQGLDESEFAALLDYAFERYYQDAGLFGTPDHCRAMIERVRGVGVDEIACLIDFGIDSQTVLDHLPWLDRVRLAANPEEAGDESLAALMRRHDVTHLQCTPSMARMMVDAGLAAAAFGPLRHLLVGGEALPPMLAAELTAMTGGEVTNMYGPTETTIWSATETVHGDIVALGRPLANQQVFIFDRRGEPVPPGVPGEIVIGGRGVTRGYLDRPMLTAERFTPHPLRPGERVYHTGDLGRFRADGTVEFLGRLDHQVKIRGHRIELGEIEAVLADQPNVAQAIVIAREDTPGDTRLCAYLVPATGAAPDTGELRQALRNRLPDVMVPAHIVILPAFPRTPNDKIDRKALPAPESVRAEAPAESFVAPAAGHEEQIAAVWRDVLKLSQVGVNDNFFDIGGHSLLAVQVHRKLRASVSTTLSIIDVFRFPTISTLSAHLGGGAAIVAAADADDVRQRAIGRLAAMGRRRGVLAQAATSDGG